MRGCFVGMAGMVAAVGVMIAWPYLHWVAVGVAGLLLGGWLLLLPGRRRERQWRHRYTHGLCVDCGYDLRGSTGEGRCPECGAPFDPRRI
jgi:hypothetical protein